MVSTYISAHILFKVGIFYQKLEKGPMVWHLKVETLVNQCPKPNQEFRLMKYFSIVLLFLSVFAFSQSQAADQLYKCSPISASEVSSESFSESDLLLNPAVLIHSGFLASEGQSAQTIKVATIPIIPTIGQDDQYNECPCALTIPFTNKCLYRPKYC